MRNIVILTAVFLIGLGAWFLLRDDGLLEQVSGARVEQALIDNGVPEDMAGCMAPRLVDRLDLEQLRKLERLAPQEGEEDLPASMGEAMARLRRVDDREAVGAVVSTAGGCGVEIGLERLSR